MLRKGAILLLLIILTCHSKTYGGDGTWEIAPGDLIKSFAGFGVTLTDIGQHALGNETILDNASYAISWNGSITDRLTLAPGEKRNLTVNGTGRVNHFLLQMGLKELGFHNGSPFADTHVSSAIFFNPSPPKLLSLNISPGEYTAEFRWATDEPANATLSVSGANYSRTLQIPSRHPWQYANLSGLAPATSYSLNLTYCIVSCNSSAANFTTLARAQAIPPPVAPPAADTTGPRPPQYEVGFLVLLPLIVLVLCLGLWHG